jgi:hypothetical protein
LVEKPLSFRTFERFHHPLAIAHVPQIPAEAKLGAIAVQMR